MHDHRVAVSRRGPAISLVMCGLFIAAAVYLLTSHRALLPGWLPYLVLLVCPVVHVVMHRGHSRR